MWPILLLPVPRWCWGIGVSPVCAQRLVSLSSEQWVLGVAWVEARELTENPSVRKLKALKSPDTLLSPLYTAAPLYLWVALSHPPTHPSSTLPRCRDLDFCVFVEALNTRATGMYLLYGEKTFAFISTNVYTGHKG